jgi:signal transduction histidine kinase
MRTVLGVLRGDEARSPYPGLEQLGELAAKGRDAGLDVELVTPSPLEAVPSAVGFAAYRIVQESITNVVRHVGPTRVRVAVEVDADNVVVSVTDAGRTTGGRAEPPPPGGGAGTGITGMRERCLLLGGELTASPVPDGGFVVRAVLPLEPAAAVR